MKSCVCCGQEIPATIVIDGKRRNLCNRKFCFQCSPYGSHNTHSFRKDDDGTLISLKVYKFKDKELICSRCGRIYVYDRKLGHQLTLCNSCVANRRRMRTKAKCVKYKGGCCEKCGYSKSLRALNFHHLNSKEKEFTIATKMSWNWNKLKAELDKCALLCANCHMELHEDKVHS